MAKKSKNKRTVMVEIINLTKREVKTLILDENLDEIEEKNELSGTICIKNPNYRDGKGSKKEE